MIDYDNDSEQMTLECDRRTCYVQEEFEGDWNSCIAQAKKRGWKISKDDHNEWYHKCPVCSVQGPSAKEDF